MSRWSNKYERRDKHRRRKKHGHKEDGRSVKFIQRLIQRRAEEARRKGENNDD